MTEMESESRLSRIPIAGNLIRRLNVIRFKKS